MIERIEADLVAAMKARDQQRTDVLKMVKAALTNARIAAKGDLDDAAVTSVLQKQVKQRQEAADLYEKANNTQRAEAERAEAAIITEYLPQQLTEAELDSIIDDAIRATAAENLQQLGMVMAELKSKVAGRADGALIATKVRQRLG